MERTLAEPLTVRTAKWVASLRFDDLPAPVVAMAKRCVLDQIGVQLRGSTLEHVRPAVDLVEEMAARPEAQIMGQALRTTAPYAAYLNGVFGHSCEYDDSHLFSWHPGTVVIPTVLAVGEKLGSSGREVIAALVAGYQAMSVIGGPMREGLHKAGWHGLKVLGPIGAGAATGHLLRLSANQMAQTLAIAISDSSGTMEYDQSGGEVKRLHAGAAARSGVQAAMLAARGFTGPLSAIEGLRGLYRLFAEGGDPDIEKFWSRDFHILDTFFKLRPAVGTVHAPLDAMEALVAAYDFAAGDVAKIEAGVAPYALAHGAAIYRPQDMIGAQFSLAFSMGLLLSRGATRLVDYADPAAWSDPAILELADKVSAHAITFDEGAPQLGSKLRVTLNNGHTFEHYQRAFRGHAENPATDADIEAKFRELVDGLLQDPDAVISRVARLEEAMTVAGLVVRN